MSTKPAYLDTVFRYIPDGKPADFWVITAWNPKSRTATPGANQEANQRLLDHLNEHEIPCFRVIGHSRDESHAEPGWGIVCDEKTALKLGRKFKQEALFGFHDGKIDWVDCKTGKRKPLDNPGSRLPDPQSLRHFTLIAGSPCEAGRYDPLVHTGVCTRVGAFFDDFVIERAERCSRSRFEEVLLIHIATREPPKALEAAHSLRCFLNRDSIGISHNGVHQRLRDWTDDELLLEAFRV